MSDLSVASEQEKVTELGSETTLELGFKQSAIFFGASYIKSFRSVDAGGYFLVQTDKIKDDVTRVNKIISVGALSKFYAAHSSRSALYLAPGVGVHNINNVYDFYNLSKKAEYTVIGPIFKIGAQYSVSSSIKMGLEFTRIYNWCDEDVPDYNLGHASVTMTFEF